MIKIGLNTYYFVAKAIFLIECEITKFYFSKIAFL